MSGAPRNRWRDERFLKGRPPNFQKFRMRNKRELETYLDGCARNLNEPPAMRKKQAAR